MPEPDVTGVSSTGATTTAPEEVVALLDAVLTEYEEGLDGYDLAVAAFAAIEQCGYKFVKQGERLWPEEAYQPTVVASGLQMVETHPLAGCDPAYPCTVHRPSEHPLKDAPLNWRGDRFPPIFERVCEHNVGHPDPDGLSYLKRRGTGSAGVAQHGCDGCCSAS